MQASPAPVSVDYATLRRWIRGEDMPTTSIDSAEGFLQLSRPSTGYVSAVLQEEKGGLQTLQAKK